MVEFTLFDSVAEELEMVEEQLKACTHSSLEVLNEASAQLIEAGGKRLRPAFVLLTAKMYGEDVRQVIPLAVALEIIHMASLVHDDVIDDSLIRRGRPTVKSTWGNRFSIYSGNHMFARSLATIATYGRSDIIRVLAEASMKICEGEMIQMAGCYNVHLGLKNYLQRIERKTAVLISVSCVLGAMLCNLSAEQVMVHKRFGYYLGMAYQITDDILDFVADEKTLGKPSGGDIRQGVITLPAIYALCYSDHKEELAAWLSSPQACHDRIGEIIDLILDSGGIDYAYDMTQAFYDRAQRQLKKLPDSEAKRTFDEVADFILNRNF